MTPDVVRARRKPPTIIYELRRFQAEGAVLRGEQESRPFNRDRKTLSQRAADALPPTAHGPGWTRRSGLCQDHACSRLFENPAAPRPAFSGRDIMPEFRARPRGCRPRPNMIRENPTAPSFSQRPAALVRGDNAAGPDPHFLDHASLGAASPQDLP